MRCNHCPCPPGPTCPGERNGEICVKADPSSPNFRSGIRRNLANWKDRDHAAQQEGDGSATRPDSPNSRPGIAAKILNLAGAVVQHVAAGAPTLSDEQTAERLAICRGCENFDVGRAGCRLCGCNMQIKANWAEQACPIGKWGPITPEPIEPAPDAPTVPASA